MAKSHEKLRVNTEESTVTVLMDINGKMIQEDVPILPGDNKAALNARIGALVDKYEAHLATVKKPKLKFIDDLKIEVDAEQAAKLAAKNEAELAEG